MKLHLRLAYALLGALSLACASPEATEATRSAFLDGRPKSFVVVGYSTSYVWPRMLQDMLDEHASQPGLYRILNAVAGGAPVEHWIAEPGTKNYERTMQAMLDDYFTLHSPLREDAPRPTVALCQQSLQFTRSRRGPVTAEDDIAGAEMGADALQKLAFQLKDAGVHTAVIAMHIYKEPVEPEVGNERIALALLIDRGYAFIVGGPDVWTVTRDAYPECFAEDGIHPNELGMKLMAASWYAFLAGVEARPEIIEGLYARDYDVEAITREYLDSRDRS